MSARVLFLALALGSQAIGCGRTSSGDEPRADADVGVEAGGGAEAAPIASASAGARASVSARVSVDAGAGVDAGTGAGVRKVSMDAKRVAEIFSKIPRLAELAEDLRLYSEPYDVNVVRKRGSEDVGNWLFTASPLLWTPAGGVPHLVLTGKSKKDAFIVALEQLPDGDYRLASSFVFRNDPGPFVLVYTPEARERLLWTSCWKCSGENGAIVARDSGRRVVVVQQ